MGGPRHGPEPVSFVAAIPVAIIVVGVLVISTGAIRWWAIALGAVHHPLANLGTSRRTGHQSAYPGIDRPRHDARGSVDPKHAVRSATCSPGGSRPESGVCSARRVYTWETVISKHAGLLGEEDGLHIVVSEPVLASLRLAVQAAPEDAVMRLHLAQLLSSAGHRDEAIRHAAAVLQLDPTNLEAIQLISREDNAVDATGRDTVLAAEEPKASGLPDPDGDVLSRLDAELVDIVPPLFADSVPSPDADSFDVERVALRLSDVGGMAEVKARLEASVLAPLRNPELARLYGKSLRGGLLLYGPPGCGKTFIARAVAGEMGARFLAVSLADVLDMYIGQSERNVRELFEVARRNSPCVIFLDEVDALGQKRSQQRNTGGRGTVNQLLSEMDGLNNNNEGVFVLGATNHPWDVDVALRRPGRFDRMLLVLPPDEPAREAILRYHLRERPIANVDARKLARKTDGFSGADLAYVCEMAAESALLDSARTGSVRMIEMSDLEGALHEVRPSIGPWLETARNVAQFANENGSYDDLLVYLRRRRLV
jgi:ATP-dependent 26S proteasome regulatory subunit